MRRLTQLLAGLLLAGAVMVLSASAPLAKGPGPAAPPLPKSILGLTVGKEDITKTLAQDPRELYVNGVWLYSLRQGRELMATLELGKFRSNSPWKSADFDLSLAGQLGSSQPAVIRLEGLPVYVATARGLEIASWYRHGYMSILAIRATYKDPKDLLRQVLEVGP